MWIPIRVMDTVIIGVDPHEECGIVKAGQVRISSKSMVFEGFEVRVRSDYPATGQVLAHVVEWAKARLEIRTDCGGDQNEGT